MPATKNANRASKKARSAKAKPAPRVSENRVPELAENMEHTLRRIAREKLKKREKDPSLYR